MDGNGRWAKANGVPRAAGHRAGLKPTRMAIQECARRGIEALTLFAFSSENWNRPPDEVSSLMTLFVDSLDREIDELHASRVRVRFIGDRKLLSVRLQARIAAAEQRIGNFLLWHGAYAELYFSPVLWPEFDVPDLEAAFAFFASRERRFGLTQSQ